MNMFKRRTKRFLVDPTDLPSTSEPAVAASVSTENLKILVAIEKGVL
jgi:hypothetical protein